MGNRQTERMRLALERAFIQLLHEKNYDSITIGDITERAGVGRSTFYRHFENKADLLLSFHVGIFDKLSIGFAAPSDWMGEQPPLQVAQFFQKLLHYGRFQPFLYSFGKDLEQVIRGIDGLLARQFEQRLLQSFSEDEIRIPFPILAQSIAGTYSWLFRYSMSKPAEYTAEQMATYAHRLVRAMLYEAMAADTLSGG